MTIEWFECAHFNSETVSYNAIFCGLKTQKNHYRIGLLPMMGERGLARYFSIIRGKGQFHLRLFYFAIDKREVERKP